MWVEPRRYIVKDGKQRIVAWHDDLQAAMFLARALEVFEDMTVYVYDRDTGEILHETKK